jgi:hypothetical protein
MGFDVDVFPDPASELNQDAFVIRGDQLRMPY